MEGYTLAEFIRNWDTHNRLPCQQRLHQLDAASVTAMSEAAEPLEDPLTAQAQPAGEQQPPDAAPEADPADPEQQMQQQLVESEDPEPEPDSRPESDRDIRPESDAEDSPNSDAEGRPESDMDENEPSRSDEDVEEENKDQSQGADIFPMVNEEKAIEDEEMPSLVTVSSTSRVDESDPNIKESEEESPVKGMSPARPAPRIEKQDDDDVSVIAIDSDEDDDVGDMRDESSLDEDESNSSLDSEDREDYDDDEDDDSRDLDDERHRNHGQIRGPPRNAGYRDSRYEEEEFYDEGEGEDDLDDEDYDQERDRNSDDAILRQRNGSIRPEKERSSSLQDLSLMEGRSPHKLNPFSQKSIHERNLLKQGRRPGGKYDYVESKVKGYIENLSEQSKQSSERRLKAREEEKMRLEQEDGLQLEGRSKIFEACQTMKVYAAKTLEEVAKEDENLYAMNQSLNGEVSIIRKRPNDNGQQIPKEEEMDVDPIAVDSSRNFGNTNQMNGATSNVYSQDDQPNPDVQPQDRRGIRRKDSHCEPILNGEITPGSVSNQRSMTYEEYMKGTIAQDSNEDVFDGEQRDRKRQFDNRAENRESTSELRIESVTSNFCHMEEDNTRRIEDRDTPPMMRDKETDMHYEQSPEVTSLLHELDKKNAQFVGLRETYQNVLSENMSMKAELHNLKNLVARHQLQKYVETIGTQTEMSLANTPLIDIDGEPSVHRNLGASMISSKWSDSTGSLGFPVEPPPNVPNALNSENDSQQSKMSSKHKNAFSRAFVTSSKILQTLSNITYGKPKVGKTAKYPKAPTPEINVEPNLVAPSHENQTADMSNSRKRKAADIEEMSSSTQPFKAPRTSKSGKSKKSQEPADPDTEISDSHAEEKDGKEAETSQTEDDVKVFVYPEDEAGKESSFLIQAKEVSDPKPGVRECGPYLLGNVEVYMTEMDGTINIWGKELSQASTSQTIDDLETSVRSKDLRPPGIRWQSTPRIDEPGSASAGRKSRVLPRFTQQQKQRAREMAQSQYGNYHDYRRPWSPHDYHYPHNPMMHGDEYGYRERRNYPPHYKPYLFYDERRHSFPDVYGQDHCYPPYAPGRCRSSFEQGAYRPEPPVRRHSFVPTDDEEAESDGEAQQKTKTNRSLNDSSKHSHGNSKLVQPSNTDRSSPGYTDDSLCQTDANLLGSKKPNSEESEARNQRLSGGKVRGLLMDLLKGCGDCRNPDISKTLGEPSTSAYQGNAYAQATPPPQQFSSNRRSKGSRTKDDRTTEIEAQLENFKYEMDKLRSRSDTLRDLLDELRSDEITK